MVKLVVSAGMPPPPVVPFRQETALQGLPVSRVGGSRPPSDSPERRAPSRMRIDWYMLQSPARLAQPLVNPHQSAVVMVNAQADALEWVQIGSRRIGEACEPRKKDDL